MRRSHVLLAVATIAAVMFSAADANAGGRSSGTRVKIHRAQLKSSLLKSQDQADRALEPCRTGDLEIGTIQAERGARVPNDVTVFVEGDVINLNDGRGSHVCR